MSILAIYYREACHATKATRPVTVSTSTFAAIRLAAYSVCNIGDLEEYVRTVPTARVAANIITAELCAYVAGCGMLACCGVRSSHEHKVPGPDCTVWLPFYSGYDDVGSSTHVIATH